MPTFGEGYHFTYQNIRTLLSCKHGTFLLKNVWLAMEILQKCLQYFPIVSHLLMQQVFVYLHIYIWFKGCVLTMEQDGTELFCY